MKPFKGQGFLWAAILVVCLLPIGCKKEITPEEKAQEILAKARALYEEGNTLEALSEYDKLIDYNTTPAYTEAEAFLGKEGYTLGKGLSSWTIKKLFEIENELLNIRPEERPIKGMTVRHPIKDGWGNFFNVEYSDDQGYAFIIISAGPDQEFGTSDDLSLPHGLKKMPPPATEPGSESATGPSDPSKEPAVAVDAPPEPTPDDMYTRVTPGEQFMKAVLEAAQPPAQEKPPFVDQEKPPSFDQGNPPSKPPREPPITIGPTGERTVDLKDLLEFEGQGKK